ncbi:MAG TPA: glycosyltransferase family 4 protein [Ramlibacter sp.]|nr:glycosyltransferase family 4 protein [Ramlibacter sp.]HSV55383.1 glycosyltransferase family 4 protein [Burkholderiaceae bacterium]
MKVTIVMGPSFPVPAIRGGAMAKTWEALSREFVRAGHHVTVVSRRIPDQRDQDSPSEPRFIRTWGFSQSGSTFYDLLKDFVYAVTVIPRLPQADVLVTNDFWVPALASIFRRTSGEVLVCAARFPKGQYGLYRRVWRIVALSGAVARAIAREQPDLAARTVVIPMPADVEALAPLPQTKAGAQRTLLFVGRVHPEKGVALLIRAFRRISDEFPHWRLRIVGPTGETDGGGGINFLQSLHTLAENAPVDFHGPVFDSGRLADVYREADLLCYPSLAERGEAFGVVPLESMAAGVAPLVSGLECFQDFVKHGVNGWVFDHRGPDPESNLARALSSIMRDDTVRAGLAGPAVAEAARHSFAAIAKRYIDEFDGRQGASLK